MSKANAPINQIMCNGTSQAFFYEDWMMNELDNGVQKDYVPDVAIEEGATEYRVFFRVQNLRKEHCSVEVDFPYLYIRIQQTKSARLPLISRSEAVHFFARHFLIPYNVDTAQIAFVYQENKLIIRLPKYYADVE